MYKITAHENGKDFLLGTMQNKGNAYISAKAMAYIYDQILVTERNFVIYGFRKEDTTK
jgi:hypothetical protein